MPATRTPSASTGIDELRSAAVHVYNTRGAHVASLYPGIDLNAKPLGEALRVALRDGVKAAN